jgi:hypothetical protein
VVDVGQWACDGLFLCSSTPSGLNLCRECVVCINGFHLLSFVWMAVHVIRILCSLYSINSHLSSMHGKWGVSVACEKLGEI